MRATGFDAEVARRLDLELDGRRAELVPVKHKVSERPGAGGLPTLRFEAVYRVTDPGGLEQPRVSRLRTSPSRIGWREIVVRAADGVRIVSVPTSRPRARATSSAPIRGTCCARRSTSPPPARGSCSGPAREPRLRSRARLHPSVRRGRSSRWWNRRTSEPASSSCRFSSPRSGAPRMRSAPGTGRRWSPRTSSARAGLRGTRSCSA